MDKQLLEELSALVGDLDVGPGTTVDDLHTIRRLAAAAVIAGQRAARAHTAAPDLGHDTHVLQPLLEDATRAPRSTLLVARRGLPITSTQPPDGTPRWASGRAIERSVGPFRDRLGRPVWIDLYRIIPHVAFVRVAGGAPFLLLPVSVPIHAPAAPRPRFTLPAGSVWIASRLIAASAPSGAYTGLRIDGGQLELGQPVAIGGNEVVIPPGVDCRLELKLHAEAAPAGTGDGADARAARAETPASTAITIAGATATFTAVGGARAEAYGSGAKLTWQPGAPEYLPEIGRISVPMHPDTTAFAIRAVASRMFTPSGEAAIDRAGWALPVAIADPATLGDASGAGGLLFRVGAGLRAVWTQQPSPVALGASLVMIDPSRLTIVALGASAEGAQHRVPLWEGTPPNVAVLRWTTAFALRFFSQATGAEALWTTASLDATVDRPLDVNGLRLPLHARTAVVIHLAWSAGVYLALFAALDGDPQRKRIGLGIANAVMLTTPPALCLLYVRLDSGPPTTGACLLAFVQRALLPTLPDPYAVNLGSLAGSLDQGSAQLISLVSWRPGHVALDFALARDAGSRLPVASRPGFGAVFSRGETTSSAAFSRGETAFAAASTGGGALEFERQRGVILLDVSTRSDQFGVAVNRDPDHVPSLSIDQLYLRARDQDVVLLTLPAVQWEAVITESDPNDPSFPHRLGFASSGVPTLLNVRSVKLVRVQPQAALDELVDNFTRPDPVPTAARFTLPFGILAAATLDKPTANSPRGAEVDYNRPRTVDLEGAHQLRIRAVDTSLPPGASPSLPGYTVQLPVGQPGNRSVLGTAVTTTFNSYLGPSGFRPLVPVTRLDLTGYGESLFSDWRNPYTDAVAVSQARFDVLIGRTSHEVIQVRSYLFPYAVQVVRTITIERKNSAVVTRRDSGWQAVSDGTYQFPAPPQLETHPGVVRRITHVTAIRDTGQIVTVDGVQLAAVRFDGDLELDGAPTLVPARDQLGFVQLTAGNIIGPDTYRKLIETAGPLGGAIDANVQVGGGRQRMRVSRVGVGVTQGMGGPEFAMAAWGSPRFPGGGQWSFVRLPSPTEAPIAVSRDGVPLIRAGAASAGPPPASSPYRFADPVDLLQPSNPDSDYGILHAIGTQRVLFPRPKVEATDTTRITSTEIPAAADPYSLATSLGLFPEIPKTIPFPSNNWSLHIDGTGNYQLVQPVNPFPITVGRRTLRQAGSVRGDVDYTGATLRYEVDTAQAVPWRFALEGSSKVMNSTDLGDVMRLGANIRASADQPTRFEQPNMKLGGSLSVVQDLLTILADLGITGVMTAEMTNEWSIKVGVKIPFRDAAGKELQIPPYPFEPPDIIFAETECSVEVKVWPEADELEFKLGGQPMFAIKSIPGLYAVAIIEFGIKVSTESGNTYSLTLGVGIAYKIEAGPFELKGLFGITIFGFVGDNVLGWGMGFLVVVSAEIEPIISIELKLEGKLAMISACRGTPNETLFGAAKLTFAIEVTIFLIFSISFEFETTGSEVLKGPGPPACTLPDVIP